MKPENTKNIYRVIYKPFRGKEVFVHFEIKCFAQDYVRELKKDGFIEYVHFEEMKSYELI